MRARVVVLVLDVVNIPEPTSAVADVPRRRVGRRAASATAAAAAAAAAARRGSGEGGGAPHPPRFAPPPAAASSSSSYTEGRLFTQHLFGPSVHSFTHSFGHLSIHAQGP